MGRQRHLNITTPLFVFSMLFLLATAFGIGIVVDRLVKLWRFITRRGA
ncbi:MAG: hypothetical protein K6T83_23355 [Alicyclobacillus sp.]|nr:hypothetical protein [Alicyclobacillus sp.]